MNEKYGFYWSRDFIIFLLRKSLAGLCLFLYLSFCAAEPVKVNDLKPLPKTKDRPSVAVVLGGGGAKGFSQVPVIEVLEEMDIPIDMVIGTSIGSIIGGLYCTGKSPDQMLELFQDIEWPKYFSFSSDNPYEQLFGKHSSFSNLLTLNLDGFSLKLGTGVCNGQKLYELFKTITLKYPSNMNFDDFEIPFRAVAVDTLNGEAYVLQDGDITEAIRASMSLPGVFEPLEIDGHVFIDGGVRYNLAINVARNLGFDIIIAVDISQQIQDDYSIYSSNPAVALLNSITIAQQTSIKELTQYADLVIKPETGKYGLMSFKNCMEIYNGGKITAQEIKPELEKLRRRIFPDDYDSAGNRISSERKTVSPVNYDKKEFLKIDEINILGEAKSDKKFLERELVRIKQNGYTDKNFETLIEKIDLAGNYAGVRVHVIHSDKGNELNLLLTQRNQKSNKIILGTDLVSVDSRQYVSKFMISPEFQMRGILGAGSLLGVRGTFLNEFSGNMYLFKAFNPNLFFEAESEYYEEEFIVQNYFAENLTGAHSQTPAFAVNKLNFGLRTRNDNTFKLGFYHKYFKSNFNALPESNDNFYFLKNKTVDSLLAENLNGFGLFSSSLWSTLNSSLFPTEGYSFRVDFKSLYPVDAAGELQKQSVLFVSGAFKQIIPAGRKFSIVFDEFCSFDIKQQLLKCQEYIPGFASSSYDRQFFPNVVYNERMGIHKYAAQIAFQFKPVDSLTIMGGDLFIRLAASLGNVFYDWNEFIPDFTGNKNMAEEEYLPVNPIYCVSLGSAFKIKNNFGIYLRAGFGNTGNQEFFGKVIPFFSIDFGKMNF